MNQRIIVFFLFLFFHRAFAKSANSLTPWKFALLFLQRRTACFGNLGRTLRSGFECWFWFQEILANTGRRRHELHPHFRRLVCWPGKKYAIVFNGLPTDLKVVTGMTFFKVPKVFKVRIKPVFPNQVLRAVPFVFWHRRQSRNTFYQDSVVF